MKVLKEYCWAITPFVVRSSCYISGSSALGIRFQINSLAYVCVYVYIYITICILSSKLCKTFLAAEPAEHNYSINWVGVCGGGVFLCQVS